MPCCSRKKTAGTEPQSIRRWPLDPVSCWPNWFHLEAQPDPAVKKPLPPSSPDIDYVIRIKTGDTQGSGTDGPVYIKIFGHGGKQTDEKLLSGSFPDNSLQTIQIKAMDIGKPKRILIRHEDTTKGWFLVYLEISVHDYLIRFVHWVMIEGRIPIDLDSPPIGG